MIKGTESQYNLGGLGGGSGGSLCVYIQQLWINDCRRKYMFLLGNTLLCVLHNIYYVSCVMYIHYKIAIMAYNNYYTYSSSWVISA